jgi:hypothetical protein
VHVSFCPNLLLAQPPLTLIASLTFSPLFPTASVSCFWGWRGLLLYFQADYEISTTDWHTYYDA